MFLAGIQKNSLDTGLRRYDPEDLDTHLCGVVLSPAPQIKVLKFVARLSTSVTRLQASRLVLAQKPHLTRPTATAA